MKKLVFLLAILQFTILNLTIHFIFSVEEKSAQKERIFFQLDPEQQLSIIEQGIKTILNSNPYPIIAILEALRYLNKATTANEFLRSKKPELEYELKLWAQEKFGTELSNVNASN